MYITHNEMTSDELDNSFYITLNKIITSLNKKENKHKIFEKNSLGKGFIAFFMIVSICVLITVRPVFKYGGSNEIVFALLFFGIGFTVLFAMFFNESKLPIKIFGLVWGVGFGGFPWVFIVLPALLANSMYLVAYIVGLVCIFIIVMMFKIMPKRTPYGNMLLGRIRGFKTFLKTAEKSRLEALVFKTHLISMIYYHLLMFGCIRYMDQEI
jgi:apolipoprotein N-acyltransferase